MDTFSDLSAGGPVTRRYSVRRYNQRMARRVANRAKLPEPAIAVAFTFNNLLTCVLLGVVEDVVRYVPQIGPLLDLLIGLVSFWFHRIVLVTETSVYVYRDWPLHIPGRQLRRYERSPGVVRLGTPNPGSGISRFIRRGQLTFGDGFIVYHGFIWIRRAQYIAQEANIPAGM